VVYDQAAVLDWWNRRRLPQWPIRAGLAGRMLWACIAGSELAMVAKLRRRAAPWWWVGHRR
jgi:hypothetical protein